MKQCKKDLHPAELVSKSIKEIEQCKSDIEDITNSLLLFLAAELTSEKIKIEA